MARRDSIITSVGSDLRIRMAVYENVLRSAAADLVASDHLSTNCEDWHYLCGRQQSYLHGIRHGGVIGHPKPVPRDQTGDFIAERRRKGSPDFKIRTANVTAPFGESPAEHLLMTCVEPPRIGAQAVGSDLNSLPRRRAAAEKGTLIPRSQVLVSDALPEWRRARTAIVRSRIPERVAHNNSG